MNDVTKKLQKLVANRKTAIVTSEQGSVKKYARSRSSGSSSDYYSPSADDA